jgi:hypothetical protein
MARRQQRTKSAWLGDGLTGISEIPVAKQREKKGQYENSEEKDLAPGEQKPEQRQQQSRSREKSWSRKSRAAPRQQGADYIRAAPHQGQQRGKRRGVGRPWPDRPACGDSRKARRMFPACLPPFLSPRLAASGPEPAIYSDVHRMPTWARYHAIETLRLTSIATQGRIRVVVGRERSIRAGRRGLEFGRDTLSACLLPDQLLRVIVADRRKSGPLGRSRSSVKHRRRLVRRSNSRQQFHDLDVAKVNLLAF